MKWLLGHFNDGRRGEQNHNWNGGRSKHVCGYVLVMAEGHPRAHRSRGYVYEHILVVEAALGKHLPLGAEVHHVDGVTDNNQNPNLVACQDRAYHMLLHLRARAFDACGHADWRICTFCKQWSPAGDLLLTGTRPNHHRQCRLDYLRQKYARRRAENPVEHRAWLDRTYATRAGAP